MVVAGDHHDGLELEQTLLGHTEGFSPDQPLSAFVRLRVRNPGDAARTLPVRLRVHPTDAGPGPDAWTLDVPAGGEVALNVKVPYTVREQPPIAISAAEFDETLQKVVAY